MNARNNPNQIKKSSWWLSALLTMTFVLAACAPAATPTPQAAAPTAPPPATEPPAAPTPAPFEATINVATDAKLGQILVDGAGMTLYMFTKDEADKVNCAGKCLENWPPLLTSGQPSLGEGVDPALVGTAPMADGTMIVTYNHMPLYYWIKDKQPGETTGQGNNDVWYVVSPAGMVIGREPTINVAEDPNLGKILVDGAGMTLYMFTKDEADKVNCAGKCLENWPPLLTSGQPSLGEGVDPALVGTAPMADGTMIVTYNHMPLYYWIKDVKPGDTTGQGNNDVWYVVSPAGMVIGREPTINVAEDPNLGKILVDGAGMALYMFTKDEPDKVNCAGKCLENWPPLLTSGHPVLGEGVDPALVGTAPMADGTMIVTYNHMPLYYWIEDVKPGETSGQGNNDVWYVVAPDGNPVGYTMPNANANSNDNTNTNANTNANSNDNGNTNSNQNSNDNGGG